MSTTVTVKLKKPLKITEGEGEEAKVTEIKELTFREATVGDLIAGETAGRGGQMAQIAATLASMCDMSLPVFRTMSARDFTACNEKAAHLLGNEKEPKAGTN